MSESWPEPAVEFVQAIADTKLVLSHRYAEWMLAGPSLEDDIGGASSAQDELGHVRQLFRLLAAQGREQAWLEGDRAPDEFRNAACLDETADDWVEFLATAAVADRAAWYLLDSITHDDFEGMVQKIGEDEFFHLEFHDARLLTLAEERPDELEAALTEALSDALAFVGPADRDEEADPLVEAGFTDRSAADVRAALVAHFEDLLAETDVSLDDVDETGPSADDWDEMRRRVGDDAVGAGVVEALSGTKNKDFAVQ